jgi:sulfatase maturation enzyme AslB (radical SAM superfamily)
MRAPNPDRWRASLILTVTRRCDLRCAYCPTVKEGGPELTPDDARRAIALFVERHGGGDIKIFGGEPLLRRDTVETVLREAPASCSVYLSTNGTRIDASLLDLLQETPSATLTVSLDGPADHDRLRGRTWDRVVARLPELLRLPRFVVTQTIAPSAAERAADNFLALRALGIRRFNLLPGYYLAWMPEEVAALRTSLARIGRAFADAWAAGDRLYLRNLFVRAPTPFFNTGLVVDSDRTIHASNLVLAQAVGDGDIVGTLDDPPSVEALEQARRRVPALVSAAYSPAILAATSAVDAALTALCDSLYPAWFAARDARLEAR